MRVVGVSFEMVDMGSTPAVKSPNAAPSNPPDDGILREMNIPEVQS